MTPEDTAKFWGRAFMTDDKRPLTPAEEDFIAAAVTRGESRWDGTCDVARMEALVDQDVSLLGSIGPALVNITLSTRGCVDALRFLLDRDVPFLIEEYRAKEAIRVRCDARSVVGRLCRQPACAVRIGRSGCDGYRESSHRLAGQRHVALLARILRRGQRRGTAHGAPAETLRGS